MYDGILTIISWRKPHLEHACTYISRSIIHVWSLFQGLPARILISIYSLRALLTYLLRFFSGIFSLGKPTLRTVFLIALFCFHARRKHDICWYICHVSTMFPCLNADLLKCLFFYHFCLGGSCLFFLFRSKHLAFKRFCGLYLLTSYCLRKPHLEQN